MESINKNYDILTPSPSSYLGRDTKSFDPLTKLRRTLLDSKNGLVRDMFGVKLAFNLNKRLQILSELNLFVLLIKIGLVYLSISVNWV